MNTTRALVLGGGGAGGNAWEIGVVAGLFDAGLDVTDADLIIGTSAGSTAAVQLRSAPPADLFTAALATPPRPAGVGGAGAAVGGGAGGAGRPVRAGGAAGAGGAGRGGGAAPGVVERMAKMREITETATDAADFRRQLGAAALEIEGEPGRWRAIVAARLPTQDWPERKILITAIDADTGEPKTFDANSGVDLTDAVAASTSGPGAPPHAIGARRYLDGGFRRNENADLAQGYDRVLILSPFSGRSLTPPAWRMQLEAQIEELREAGSQTETIFPDDNAKQALGIKADGTSHRIADPSVRTAAAQAGYDQGRAAATRLTKFWR